MGQKGIFKNMTGQVFGRLTVTGYSHTTKHGTTYWHCICECGKENLVSRSNLVSGSTSSCGCLGIEHVKEANTKHGETHTKLFVVWHHMRERCMRPTHKSWEDYGGRGITICKEWDEFIPFRDWAQANGYQEGLTIDRIDNNGNYTPENCRWVSMITQSNNRRSNRRIKYYGHDKTVSEWARFLGMSKVTLRWRLDRCNDDLEYAVTEPFRSRCLKGDIQ